MPDVTPQDELVNPYAGDGESDFADPADSSTPHLDVPDGQTDFDMGEYESVAGYSPAAVEAGDGIPSADLPPITTPVERNAVATVPTKGEDFVSQYDESTIVPSQTDGSNTYVAPATDDTSAQTPPTLVSNSEAEGVESTEEAPDAIVGTTDADTTTETTTETTTSSDDPYTS